MIVIINSLINLASKIFRKHVVGGFFLAIIFTRFLGVIYELLFKKSFEVSTNPIWIVINVIMIFLIPVLGIISFFVFKGMIRDEDYRTRVYKKVKNILRITEKVKEEQLSPDAFILNLTKGQLTLHNIFNGVMIIGQPGSGKTDSIILVLIKQIIDKDLTGLIYDLKGKLGDEVMSFYNALPDKQRITAKLRFINFANPSKSHRVNPISPEYFNNKAEGLDFVGTLLENLMATNGNSKGEDPFWFNNAKNILTAIVWYLRNNHPKFCTIPHAIAFVYWKDTDQLIEALESDPESARMISTLRASSESKDKKLFINIISTLYTHLMALDLPELFYVLTGNEVNLNVNSNEDPTLLTIANHEPLQKVYSPIISVICSVVTQRMNEEGKRKGVIMFDEFASIKVPNFERIPETIRSRGVATIIALHDKQQLITKYGEPIAETIASTLATKFYFKSTNFKTVDEAIKVLGRRDVRYKVDSASKSTSTILNPTTNTEGKSETVQERDFLRVDEITNYERGEFAGIFSDASIKYGKGLRVALSPKPTKCGVPVRDNFSQEMVESNYRQVYADIESIFSQAENTRKVSSNDIKVDFD